jgi:ParB family chromosome partitioning protein
LENIMTTTKKHVSLKAMAEDKDYDAVGKITNFLVDPAEIQVRPGFNPRPINQEHVAEMLTAYENGAQFDPLVVDVENGTMYVVAGHHRREMYLAARAKGHEVKRVEARQFKGTPAERIALTITSQQGLALTPLQMGTQYAKLESLGWTKQEIADRIGKTTQHVRDNLMLNDAPAKAKALLEAGKVSADVVRAAMRKHGADAGDVLEGDVGEAEAKGETKVTAKNASTKAPSKKDQELATALELLAWLRDEAEALDGTTKENEAMLDKYREFMVGRGVYDDEAK